MTVTTEANEMRKEIHALYLKRFGLNLRRIRKENKITMENLAIDSEIDYRQIGRIERGEINTTVISLCRIAESLQVDLYLFFENN